jgi:hypothetical protein
MERTRTDATSLVCFGARVSDLTVLVGYRTDKHGSKKEKVSHATPVF